MPSTIRANSRLGKYRILRKVGQGGFATVYRGRDTIEGIDVALKIPNAEVSAPGVFDELRREVRITARMEHPNILQMKNAEVIDGRFVIAYPLGHETLAERLQRRMTSPVALELAEQAIAAVAYAHERKIIHCDIKPDNIILFPGNRLRLGDFGIAKVAMHRATLASGQGTVGYIAPEQALGKPSLRSDVFSLGVLIYRMFAGVLPTWPYDWPPRGFERAERRLGDEMLALLQRCMQVDDRRRFANASVLQTAFQRIRGEALRGDGRRARSRVASSTESDHWRTLRIGEFMRRHGRALEMRGRCEKCQGPVSESMSHCPWCATPIEVYRGPHRFRCSCGRCGRSAKPDWRYCAYCYGGAIQPPSKRSYVDRRYTTSCRHCGGQPAPHMRYCPHCRRRTTRRWKLPRGGKPCKGCGWGVAADYWAACPWCGKGLPKR